MLMSNFYTAHCSIFTVGQLYCYTSQCMTKNKKSTTGVLEIFTHFNVFLCIEGLFEMALFCGDFNTQ